MQRIIEYHLCDICHQIMAPASIPDVTAATAINGLAGVDIAACRILAEERGAKFRQRELNQVG